MSVRTPLCNAFDLATVGFGFDFCSMNACMSEHIVGIGIMHLANITALFVFTSSP